MPEEDQKPHGCAALGGCLAPIIGILLSAVMIGGLVWLILWIAKKIVG